MVPETQPAHPKSGAPETGIVAKSAALHALVTSPPVVPARLTGRLPLRCTALRWGRPGPVAVVAADQAGPTTGESSLVLPQYAKERRRRLGRRTLRRRTVHHRDRAHLGARADAPPLVRGSQDRSCSMPPDTPGRGLIGAPPQLLGYSQFLAVPAHPCRRMPPGNVGEDRRIAPGRTSAILAHPVSVHPARDLGQILAIGRSSASCTRDTRPSPGHRHRFRGGRRSNRCWWRHAALRRNRCAPGAGIPHAAAGCGRAAWSASPPDQLPNGARASSPPSSACPPWTMVLVAPGTAPAAPMLFAFAERLPRGAG